MATSTFYCEGYAGDRRRQRIMAASRLRAARRWLEEHSRDDLTPCDDGDTVTVWVEDADGTRHRLDFEIRVTAEFDLST